MVANELLAFVRANLQAPPVRLLEVGAGDGALARSLAKPATRCSRSTRNLPEQMFVL